MTCIIVLHNVVWVARVAERLARSALTTITEPQALRVKGKLGPKVPPELRTTLTYVRLALGKPFKFECPWGNSKATRSLPPLSLAKAKLRGSASTSEYQVA